MARVADGEIGIKALVTPRRRLAIVIAFALRYCRCSVVGQCLGYIYDEEKGVDGFLSHDKLLIEETCKPRRNKQPRTNGF